MAKKIILNCVNFSLIGLLCFGSVSCNSTVQNRSANDFQVSGSLVITKPVPLAKLGSNNLLEVVGFLPLQSIDSDPKNVNAKLVIDRNLATVSLTGESAEMLTVPGDLVQTLKAGMYSVIHKQKNPLWYAPDSYFESRSMAVPAKGDKARYRRGALGSFAIFINSDIPLHNSPIWSSEVGGVRVKDQAMLSLFEKVDVGDTVEIR